MRTWIVIASFLVLTAVSANAGGGGKLPFITDPSKGFKQAKSSGKAAMVYFTASW